MTVRRTLINALDRPGLRFLLAHLTTRVASKATGVEMHVFYDGLWMHVVNGVTYPDSRHFTYHSGSFADWVGQPQRQLEDCRDYWFHAYTPKPGDVILDVGAGRGEDTMAFSRAVGPEGTVVAVEANPWSCRLLEEFIRRNRLDNVRVLNAAVADRPGAFFIETEGDWQTNSLHVHSAANAAVAPVAGTTVDLICELLKLSRVDLLKMNIEGAERLAMRGMVSTLRTTRNVCIACHDFRAARGEGGFYRSREEVTDFLTNSGFRIRTRADDPRPSVRDYIYASRA